MTTALEPVPKILIGLGAPDGMTRAEATKRFAQGRLFGVSAITKALIPALTERRHPYATIMFGPSGPVDEKTARAVLDRTEGRVLINMICEPDLHSVSLNQVARFELETQIPTVNPSWAVAATTRPLIARRLAHQTGVRAPHCSLYKTGTLTLLEHIEEHGHRYPVLLRPLGQHGSVGLLRIDDAHEIATKVGSLRSCTVTDFVNFRSGDGLWRKYRMVYAGDRVYRRHVLTDREWNLTRRARNFMREHPELVAEEQEWINRQVAPQSESVESRVMHQFRALQLDFGVIDFALPPDGDLVIFEINACVQLTNPESEQAEDERRHVEANNDEILDGLLDHVRSRVVTG